MTMLDLEEVYRLAADRKFDDAIDIVFDVIDRLCSDGRFDLIDAILSSVDPDRLTDSLMRSFLVITAAAKDRLPARPKFYEDAFAKVAALQGEAYARRILERLK